MILIGIRMDAKTILVVADEEPDTAAIESVVSDGGETASVRTLTDLTHVYEELCHSIVHCLVLPAAVDETAGVDVARGVRGLFPDLPIVLTGTRPAEIPDDLAVTAVDVETFDDAQVGEAIAAQLAAANESAAARPPSRMETLLLSMFEQLPVHLYAKDDEARHVMVSRNELEPTDLIGQTDREFTELPPDHREAALADERRIIDTGEPLLEIEEYTDYIDSHSLTSKVPWRDADGDVIGLVGLTRDITERKVNEHAARRQHERLAKVALVAAHELRNELQVADGRLRLVEDDPSQVDVIADSHERLSSIVDRVIELASEERADREAKAVWLSTLSREVWDTIDQDGGTLEIEPDARLVVDAESAGIFLQILFANALEHNDGTVTVTVGATTDGFFVADDGGGIEVDPPERIFDAGYTSEAENSGFGLYVARTVAEEQGWTLSIADSGAGGARFDVAGVAFLD